MVHVDVYVDEYVDLTDRTVIGAMFDGCVLRLDKGGFTWIEQCVFKDCKKIGDGWPKCRDDASGDRA